MAIIGGAAMVIVICWIIRNNRKIKARAKRATK